MLVTDSPHSRISPGPSVSDRPNNNLYHNVQKLNCESHNVQCHHVQIRARKSLVCGRSCIIRFDRLTM